MVIKMKVKKMKYINITVLILFSFLNFPLASIADDAEQLYKKAFISYSKKKYDSAISESSRAIAVQNNHFKALNIRGLSYMRKAMYNKALQDINRAIQINSDYAYSYINKGFIYRKMNNINMAIQCFKKSIELDVNNFQGYFNLACCYGANNNKRKALFNLEKSVNLFIPVAQVHPKVLGFYYNYFITEKDLDIIRSEVKYQQLLTKLNQLKNDS